MPITLEGLTNKLMDQAPLLITAGVGAYIIYSLLFGKPNWAKRRAAEALSEGRALK